MCKDAKHFINKENLKSWIKSERSRFLAEKEDEIDETKAFYSGMDQAYENLLSEFNLIEKKQ